MVDAVDIEGSPDPTDVALLNRPPAIQPADAPGLRPKSHVIESGQEDTRQSCDYRQTCLCSCCEPACTVTVVVYKCVCWSLCMAPVYADSCLHRLLYMRPLSMLLLFCVSDMQGCIFRASCRA